MRLTSAGSQIWGQIFNSGGGDVEQFSTKHRLRVSTHTSGWFRCHSNRCVTAKLMTNLIFKVEAMRFLSTEAESSHILIFILLCLLGRVIILLLHLNQVSLLVVHKCSPSLQSFLLYVDNQIRHYVITRKWTLLPPTNEIMSHYHKKSDFVILRW